MLALLVACSGGDDPDGPTPSPAEAPWTPPVYDGDGLPASEGTDHETDEETGDGAATPAGDDDDGLPDLVITDGLFAWAYDEDHDTWSASLVLLEATLGCHDMYGALDSVSPDGLYYTLTPLRDAGGSPTWPGLYAPCGTAPCFRGYAAQAGEYTELEQTAWLSIDTFSAHYVTASWGAEVSSGSGLTFYNCGDQAWWYY